MLQMMLMKEPCTVQLVQYGNRRLALEVFDGAGFPMARLSINVDEVTLDEDEFILSHDCLRLKDEVLESDLFEDTGRRVDYGMVAGQPVLRLAGDAALEWAKVRDSPEAL